ncbi:MAG: MFS transporter, partial [Solirubrobacteraceae bacterium]
MSHSTIAPPDEPVPAKPPVPRSAWTRLAACTAAAALLQLDGTLITVALPSVAHGLHVKGSTTSTVLSAYFGAYALLLLPGGELVDRFGARRLALSGLVVFAVGALAGALAQSFGALLVARIVQGAGAGLV